MPLVYSYIVASTFKLLMHWVNDLWVWELGYLEALKMKVAFNQTQLLVIHGHVHLAYLAIIWKWFSINFSSIFFSTFSLKLYILLCLLEKMFSKFGSWGVYVCVHICVYMYVSFLKKMLIWFSQAKWYVIKIILAFPGPACNRT